MDRTIDIRATKSKILDKSVKASLANVKSDEEFGIISRPLSPSEMSFEQ